MLDRVRAEIEAGGADDPSHPWVRALVCWGGRGMPGGAPAPLLPASTHPLCPSSLQVHSGFLAAYDSVRPAVLALLQRCLGAHDGGGAGQRWSLHLTGHSLGSALATLCAWDCAHRAWATPPELHVMTFGSPRVGSRSWAHSFNELVPDTFRFVSSPVGGLLISERDAAASAVLWHPPACPDPSGSPPSFLSNGCR